LRSALNELGKLGGLMEAKHAKDDLTAHPRDLIINPAIPAVA
jgi:hypothetical protein